MVSEESSVRSSAVATTDIFKLTYLEACLMFDRIQFLVFVNFDS